ncbi:MAG: phosphatidylinositol kinase [Acidobacteriia bacterium]|nr:phosphatidylinositol kinase [Terriglobia bacterium]
MAIDALQHVRRMRGGAQSHLMRAADGHFYVVKFQNNPQHLKVLANEFLATRIAGHIGLPVPAVEAIEVSDWLIRNTAEMRFESAGHSSHCLPGLHFGARYVCDPFEGHVFDYLPEGMFERVANRETFAGILAVDKWLGNADGRQAVFWKNPGDRHYRVSFVDQGYCFNAGEWNFPDLTLHGIYYRNHAYAHVLGWPSFEPWLTRIEKFSRRTLNEIAGEIPPLWCEGEWDALAALVQEIMERRSKVRELIAAFRDSSRQPFPNWMKEEAAFSTQPSAFSP